MAVTVRPAKLEDLEALGVALERPGYWVAAVDGERVLGAGGITAAGAVWVAACVIRPEVRAELRRYRRALLAAARAALAPATRMRVPVYAEPDEDVANAAAFLEHLGFRPHPAGGYLLEAPRG